MTSKTDKTWRELGFEMLGLLALMFGVEAGTWYVAHQFAWWTFALAAGGSFIGWQFVKAIAIEGREALRARRRRRAA